MGKAMRNPEEAVGGLHTILVLGDAFVDQYFIGTIRGMSAEAPVPIVDVIDTKEFPGGAWNVQDNLKALKVKAVAPLAGPGNIPIKNRLVTESNLQLARWDERDYCSPIRVKDIIPYLPGLEAVVVSDYRKGSITEDIEEFLLALELPLFVDTKSDPLPWFQGGDYVTLFPNTSEYMRYRSSYDWFPKVLLKRGPEGLAWLEYGRGIITRPSLAKEVVSVNGAGDTVLAAFVKAWLEDRNNLIGNIDFANMAAAVVVGKPYTSTVTVEEIRDSKNYVW